MKHHSVTKNSFVETLVHLPKESLSVVGKNISSLSSSQSFLPSQVSLPSALVVESALLAELLNHKPVKERIKKFLRQYNGADRRAKQRLIRLLQNTILHTPLTKHMEREIMSMSKKLFGQIKQQTFQVDAFVFSEDNLFYYPSTQRFTLKTEKDVAKVIHQALSGYFASDVVVQAERQGYEHTSLRLSLLIQKVFPVLAHGTISSFHEDSGFDGVMEISCFLGQPGLPKKQGLGDYFLISKRSLSKNKYAILSRTCGQKSHQDILTKRGQVKRVAVPDKDRVVFSLSEQEVMLLSQVGAKIAKQFGPCRLDWQKVEGRFMVQTIDLVSLVMNRTREESHTLSQPGKILVKGSGFGKRIAGGKIHCIQKASDLSSVHYGDILLIKEDVNGIHNFLKKVSGLIVSEDKKDKGFVLEARELSLPVVILPSSSLSLLKNGKRVTMGGGNIYVGALPFEVDAEADQKFFKTKTKIMLNIANPQNAFFLPSPFSDGAILSFESLFTSLLPIHPLAFIQYPHLKDKKTKRAIEDFTRGWKNKTEGAVEVLAGGIATVAAAFFPAPVTVRLSNFTGSDFALLAGASEYSQVNPLHLFESEVGDELTNSYLEAFRLQCKALKKVRDDMGFTNIIIMAPFCATPAQGEKVLQLLADAGLKRGENGLQIYGRYEIPANFILADEFVKIFDGFSLSPQELNRFAFLGVSGPHSLQDRHDPVKTLIKKVIHLSHVHHKPVIFSSSKAIEPSDFIRFLVQQKIDSLSFPADLTFPMKTKALALEKTVGRTGDRTHKGFLSMVVGVGAMAALLIGMGAGCNVNFKQEIEDAKKVTEFVPPAKIREEVEKSFKAQIAKLREEKTVAFSESGFSQFRLQYPASWSLSHFGEGLKIEGSTSTQFIRIVVAQETGFDHETEGIAVGVDGKSGKRVENKDSAGNIYSHVIEIPLENKKVLVIEGQGEQFEKIIASIKWNQQ